MASPSIWSLYQDIVSAAIPFTLLACIYFMNRRQQHRLFPIFFCYLAAVLFNNWIRTGTHIIYGNSIQHFYVYWGSDAINVGLSFAVLYEVLRNVLTAGTIKVSGSNFFLIISSLLIVSAVLAFFTTPHSREPALIRAILTAEGAARFAQVGVLLLFAVLTLFFGFYWRNHSFGIAAGFGLYGAVMLVNATIRQHAGRSYDLRFGLTDISAYLVAALIWLFYAWKRPKPMEATLPADKLSDFSEGVARLIK